MYPLDQQQGEKSSQKSVLWQFAIQNRTVALILQRGGFRFLALGQYVAGAFIYRGFCGRHSSLFLFVLGCSLHIRPRLCEARPTVLQATRLGGMQSQMAARIQPVRGKKSQNGVYSSSARLSRCPEATQIGSVIGLAVWGSEDGQ